MTKLPEGTHQIVDGEMLVSSDAPHDYEMEVSWNCFLKCTKAFPNAEVTYHGYPDYVVQVTPTGCIEGLSITSVEYAEDEDMVDFTAEVIRMTVPEQLELPLE